MYNMKIKRDVILIEKPFSSILFSLYRLKKCDYCFRSISEPGMVCEDCQYPRYCGLFCKILASYWHSFECPFLKKLNSFNDLNGIPESFLLLVRVIAKLKNGGDRLFSTDDQLNKKTFFDIPLRSSYKNDYHKLKIFIAYCKQLPHVIGYENMPHCGNLWSFFCRVYANAVDIQDKGISCGKALYISLPNFKHSCDPNSVKSFFNSAITLKATKKIDNFNWNKVTMNYIDGFYSSREKHYLLKKELGIECIECVPIDSSVLESAAALHSMRCQIPKCHGFIPIFDISNEEKNKMSAFICNLCGSEVLPESYDKYMYLWRKAIDIITSNKSSITCTEVNNCLKEQRSLVFPYDALYLHTIQANFEINLVNHKIEPASRSAFILMMAHMYYNNTFTWNYISYLMFLANCEKQVGDFVKSYEYYCEAEKISESVLTSYHPVVNYLKKETELLSSILSKNK